MTYKTRKQKKTKKIKGGDIQSSFNQPSVNKPTLNSNFDKLKSIGSQLGVNALGYVVNKVAEVTNTNPNLGLDASLEQGYKKLESVNTALKSEKGKELLGEVNQLVSNVTNEVVAPAFQEISDIGLSKMDNIGKQGIKVAKDLVAEVPVVGPILEIPILASDVIKAGEEIAETGAEMTGTASKAVGQLTDKTNDAKNIFSEMGQLFNDNVDKTLNIGQEFANSSSRALDQQEQEIKKIPDISQIQKGGYLSAKRVKKSIDEFLKPKIQFAKIKGMYGGKTKRYKIHGNGKRKSRKNRR